MESRYCYQAAISCRKSGRSIGVSCVKTKVVAGIHQPPFGYSKELCCYASQGKACYFGETSEGVEHYFTSTG